MKSKFGIEAVIIRSGTASSLEKKIRTNENIFRAFPYQIISIDYIKTGTKLQVFLDHARNLSLSMRPIPVPGRPGPTPPSS
jgi:hypothetical protein